MSVTIDFSDNWKYIADFKEDYIEPRFDDTAFDPVCLPHTNKILPYNYFDERIYQFVSCYRKNFKIPAGNDNKRIYLDFEGVMTYAEVYINGKFAGSHKGGYTEFSVDITNFYIREDENVITVKVDSTERSDIPPFGKRIDYLTYGGIYRNVQLRLENQIFIERIFANPCLDKSKGKSLSVEVAVRNFVGLPCTGDWDICLKTTTDVYASKSGTWNITGENEQTFLIETDVSDDVLLWDIDNPNLYTVEVSLKCAEHESTVSERIGFRSAYITADGFYLNGERIVLRGLNRHQSFPYVGYAMPARVQRKDADILKYELGLNIARSSHYPSSKHFLNRCDEIGLLVFEEIPGWQHIGDEEWQKVACDNVREMITRDYNHPSIILWGVRINESRDDHEFYSKTNSIAREIDKTRQTCGVRCITDSEFLEDVFTFNDFIYEGNNCILRDQRDVTGLNEFVPYLVTEYNGHKFPVKRFDCEQRQMEHTLRHFAIMNRAAEDKHISGAIGWCAFDYNTHSDFGSGDRICYHGVMDMFRIPKFAAYAYQSQISVKQKTVLEPVTVWARGERDSGEIAPMVICTNCDYIELWIGEEFIGRFNPDFEGFPFLSHPPVIIQELLSVWGGKWDELTVNGFVNHENVIQKKMSSNPYSRCILAVSDDDRLISSEMDATRITYAVKDIYGNTLPYFNDCISFEIEGPGEIMGPNVTSLIGGVTAIWVKTIGQKGVIKINAQCSGMNANCIEIQVE